MEREPAQSTYAMINTERNICSKHIQKPIIEVANVNSNVCGKFIAHIVGASFSYGVMWRHTLDNKASSTNSAWKRSSSKQVHAR